MGSLDGAVGLRTTGGGAADARRNLSGQTSGRALRRASREGRKDPAARGEGGISFSSVFCCILSDRGSHATLGSVTEFQNDLFPQIFCTFCGAWNSGR